MQHPVTDPARDLKTGATRMPRIAYLVGRLDRALRRHIADAVGPMGLTTQQYTALSVLSSKGRLSNARLAQHSFVSPQAANEMVKTLEAKGFVCRQQNPSHGRIIWIKLTPAGENVLAQCDQAMNQLESVMLSEIPVDERQKLATYLASCARALGTGAVEY